MRLALVCCTLGLAGTAIAAESADLTITVESSNTTVVHAGQRLGFTVMAANGGPGDATGARVVASFPATMAGMTWTCEASEGVACPAAGSGDVDLTLDLPVGAVAVFTGVGTAVDAGAATLTASVLPSSGQTDSDPSNNAASLETTVAAALPDVDPTPGTSGEVSPESGGCAVASGGRSPVLGFLLVGLVVALRRRPRA